MTRWEPWILKIEGNSQPRRPWRTFGFLFTMRWTEQSLMLPLARSFPRGRSSFLLMYSTNAGVKSMLFPVTVIGASFSTVVDMCKGATCLLKTDGDVNADTARTWSAIRVSFIVLDSGFAFDFRCDDDTILWYINIPCVLVWSQIPTSVLFFSEKGAWPPCTIDRKSFELIEIRDHSIFPFFACMS